MGRTEQSVFGFRRAAVGAVAVSEWNGNTAPESGPPVLLVQAPFASFGRDEARELAALLTAFADTGRLPAPETAPGTLTRSDLQRIAEESCQ